MSAETQDRALCPHTADHSQPKWGVQLPSSTQPPPSFLRPPPLLTATGSAQKHAEGFFCGSSGPDGFRKRNRGLSPPSLSYMQLSKQFVLGLMRWRGVLLEESFPSPLHTRAGAGSTALPSIFPPVTAGTGTSTKRGIKTGTPEAHHDAQHCCSPPASPCSVCAALFTYR